MPQAEGLTARDVRPLAAGHGLNEAQDSICVKSFLAASQSAGLTGQIWAGHGGLNR
jgi:hypothetical protein